MSAQFKNVFDVISIPERLNIPSDDLETTFWLMYPRFRFFKTLPYQSKLLDIGASTGGLSFWREWLYPRRTDIKMYGADLIKGEHARYYDGWDVLNLDERRPNFPGVSFDGFLASHLIEHIASLESLLEFIQESANDGARLYFEWPSPKTTEFPKASELAERGFTIQTCNFFDDNTHRQTYDLTAVEEKLEKVNFQVVERGEIKLGAVAEEMLARGRRLDNLIWRQMGFWSAVGWSNYIIAEKRG